MDAPRLRRIAGWLLLGCSVILLAVAGVAFIRQPDRLAALTVIPIWVWGAAGLGISVAAAICLRSRLAIVVPLGWIALTAIGADELKPLLRYDAPRPEPGPAGYLDRQPVLRVLTLNCNFFLYNGGRDLTSDILRWDPDILLLQEVIPDQAKHIAEMLYQGMGDYRTMHSNAVVTRWKITRSLAPHPPYRLQQATVRIPHLGDIEVMNVHLRSAATDLRFWRAESWRNHAASRSYHREEISAALSSLSAQAPGRPIIFGGDFNSTPGDPLQRLLRPQLTDAFATAGSGWGNTYQRRIPIHRIDQIHHSRGFVAARSAAITSRSSDHRMVIADLVQAR